MRSHFHNGYPQGTHCCVQCSLAVHTVLEAGATGYFDGRWLSQDVKDLVQAGGSRVTNQPNAKMVSWTLGRAG